MEDFCQENTATSCIQTLTDFYCILKFWQPHPKKLPSFRQNASENSNFRWKKKQDLNQ